MFMVNIVTGRINSGKTSKLLKLYDDLQKGDGFVSIKNMENDKVLSYDVMQLSNRQKQLLVLREDYLTDDWYEYCRIGPYSFSKNTIHFVERKLRELMKEKVSPIFLDEIGPLELEGKCFHRIFSELLQEGCELYITVREDSIYEVINKYHISHERVHLYMLN